MDGTTAATALGEGPTEDYLVVSLAVGIPCGLIILVLLILVIFIVYLTARSSSADIDEIEATYMRKRFQGLSLEDQRRLAEKQKRKKKRSDRIHTRRSSSTTESSKSSLKLTPYSKRAKIRQGNPFELQEWQLKMSGIDVTPKPDETDLTDDSPHRRSPIGALNPLMLVDESTADYDPAPKGQKSSSNIELSEDEGSSSSSDSMNPYDD